MRRHHATARTHCGRRVPAHLLLALFFVVSLALSAVASAQIIPRPSRDDDDGPPGLGSPTDEMRYKAAIRQEEASHKEMLGRAEEATLLSAELRSSFERNKSLGRDELKKLERVEKLARKIRSRAGGSDDEEPLTSPPDRLETAIKRLAEVSERLQQTVKKTSRHVVSAAAIELSNELIELARYARASVQP